MKISELRKEIRLLKIEYNKNFSMLLDKIEDHIFYYTPIDINELNQLLKKESDLNLKSSKLKAKLWEKVEGREPSGGFISLKLYNIPIYKPSFKKRVKKIRKERGF